MSEETQETKRNYSDETFTVVLWEEYPEDNEYRELHCTFSKSFFDSDQYKQNGSPKVPAKMHAQEIQNLAEKCGIFLFLHNREGAAVERFIYIDKVLQTENGKHYQNMWINGEQIPFADVEEYTNENGEKKHRFIGDDLGLSEKAKRIIHGKKIQNKVALILAD